MQAKRGESEPSQETEDARPNVLPLNTLGERRRDAAEWSGPGLNWRHTDFQSVALPTELPDQNVEKSDFPASAGVSDTTLTPKCQL